MLTLAPLTGSLALRRPRLSARVNRDHRFQPRYDRDSPCLLQPARLGCPPSQTSTRPALRLGSVERWLAPSPPQCSRPARVSLLYRLLAANLSLFRLACGLVHRCVIDRSSSARDSDRNQLPGRVLRMSACRLRSRSDDAPRLRRLLVDIVMAMATHKEALRGRATQLDWRSEPMEGLGQRQAATMTAIRDEPVMSEGNLLKRQRRRAPRCDVQRRGSAR